jgi:tetratricopeptide (TPR) repeat protein
MIRWFDASEATRAGAALADTFSDTAGVRADGNRAPRKLDQALESVLSKADREVGPLNLNFYKRAKFANSFRWRLIEKGLEEGMADQITQSLVMHLSVGGRGAESAAPQSAEFKATPQKSASSKSDNERKQLLAQGNRLFERQDFVAALESYEALLEMDPRNHDAISNRGSALWKLGRYSEAEQCYREAIAVKPSYAEAHSNLADVLRWKGDLDEAERHYRESLKIKPNAPYVQCNLGLILIMQGQLRDAKARFNKVLKTKPLFVEALVGLGQIAAVEGRFAEAEAFFRRAMDTDPKAPIPVAALAGIRKMTEADREWLVRASTLADSGLPPTEEASVRFAMGKYFDDVQQFDRAFQSYRRANDILKPLGEPYPRELRKGLLDQIIRNYPRRTVERLAAEGCADETPVLLVGMPRSGTSLVEQILCSHPDIRGAGELAFWSQNFAEHELIEPSNLDKALRDDLVQKYLNTLTRRAAVISDKPNAASAASQRIIDKATFNADLLGCIHAILPRARIIYMRRDPVDICLSCYFQQLPLSLNFTLDLSDLAHYYRQHVRIMEHWKAVLPEESLLEVSYEELVGDAAGWTRRMLEFVGVPWDDRCLNFQDTQRVVATASFWQVRQKIYKSSIARWRHYEQFLGPLRDLK